MAVRSSRNTGLIVTLVTFVFLTIVGIALSIVFYSQRTEFQKQAQSAQQEADALKRGAANLGELQAEAQRAQRGPIAHLQVTLDNVKRLLSGSEQMTIPQIERAMQGAGVPQGQNALAHIQQLAANIKQAETDLAGLDGRINDLQQQLEALDAMKAQIEQIAAQQSEALIQSISAIREGVTAFDERQNRELARLSTDIEQAKENYNKQRIELENKFRDTEKERDKLKAEVIEARGSIKRETPSAPDPTQDVDGTVIAIPADNNKIAYINLGRRDHLVLGMTFEVFDAQRGVEVEALEAGRVLKRGKATIEVITMTDNSAACRVVRSTFGQPVQEGDLIANLVYDKERTFKFFVFGDFNLDGIGEATLTDRRMVVNLIERWGGTVVDVELRQRELAAAGEEGTDSNLLPLDTDFLVLGQEPKLGESNPDDPASIAARTQALAERERQKRLEAEANALGIPILNQNRFLALIGYYQR